MTTTALLARFVQELQYQGCAAGTIYRYRRIVEDFLEYSGAEMTREQVIAFTQEFAGKSGSFRRWITYALKRFFQTAEVPWPIRKSEIPKLSEPRQPYLDLQKGMELLEEAKAVPRDHALFRVALAAGPRRQEIVNLLRTDYQPPNLRIVTLKGGDTRLAILDNDTINVLSGYLASRGDTLQALFLTDDGNPITPSWLSQRFRQYARKLGLGSGAGLHTLRRSWATWLFQGGMRELEIQRAGGWKSLAMPARYVRLVPGEVQEKALASHPFSRKSTP